jgi:hypothetical protein
MRAAWQLARAMWSKKKMLTQLSSVHGVAVRHPEKEAVKDRLALGVPADAEPLRILLREP